MKNLLFTLLILMPLSLWAQVDRSLTGFWRGAVIRTGNSVQLMDVEIREQGDSLVAGVQLPEWLWASPQEANVTREGQVVRFETPYGEAELVFDTTYLELVGIIGKANPPLNLHLKKTLKPYEAEVFTKEIKIENQGAKISGTLYYPKRTTEPLSCAVIVHGRGCAPRQWKASRARKLATYGIAGFVYDKRGSEPSGFDCEKSTHDYNVSDVRTIVARVAEQPEIDADKIGLVSYSAGAWIVPEVAATSDIKIVFMITFVGPATSVMEQQLDGGEAFARTEGYSEEMIAEGLEYTRLMSSTKNLDQVYDRMQVLLQSARKTGWIDWLVEDDIPPSAEGIKDLWVQRFAYDPREDLASFEQPFLAVLAENDPIVPYQKQIDRFHEIFRESGKTNYEIKVLAGSGHGLQHGSTVQRLGYNETFESTPYYYKFYRRASGAFQYMIDFLDKHQFLVY